jgi:hypothetical protein
MTFQGVFQGEDNVLKCSAGAPYDRMWGPHGRGVIWERIGQALAHVSDYSVVGGDAFCLISNALLCCLL